MGGMPLVAITGQKAIKTSKQGMFQKVEIVEIMQPVTKMSRCIAMSSKIPVLVRRAFRHAESERPGAVLLELPEDIAKEEVAEQPLPPIKTAIPIPGESCLEEARARIEKAKDPVIVIGSDAVRTHIFKPLADFIQKTKIPFSTTQMGKGVIDETNECYLGTTALSQNDYLHLALEHADVIIAIGHNIREKPPFLPTERKQSLVHINFTEADISQIYQPEIEVIGDIGVALTLLTKALTPQASWDFSYFRKVQKILAEHLKKEESQAAKFPFPPQTIIEALKKAVPDNAVIALDNGMYKIWLTRNFPARWHHHIILDNALASMGAGLPSAIAAKLVYPDRPVIALCGDGGFMMNSQELETAKRIGLDLTILLLTDNAYGMIKWKQEEMGLPNFGLDFDNRIRIILLHYRTRQKVGAYAIDVAVSKSIDRNPIAVGLDGGIVFKTGLRLAQRLIRKNHCR
jgi:acetolactate synthase-1/2/3 large subunit